MDEAATVKARLERLKGPGLLWVGSKIKKKELLDWSTFLKWYDEDMIPTTTSLGGIRSALRSTARDQSEEWPNLCLFAMDDLAVIREPKFQKLFFQSSELLPSSGKHRDMADFDCRYYHIVNTCETGKVDNLEKTKCLLITSWDFRAEVSDEEFDEWYYTAHCDQMKKVAGFLRSTRFRIDHGWWSSGDGAELPCPDWIELCEYDSKELDVAGILNSPVTETPKTQDLMSRTTFQVDIYYVEKVFGDKTMFNGFGRGCKE